MDRLYRTPVRALYGRSVERLELEAAIAAPANRVVVAAGEAGLGKTSLMDEQLRRLADDGALVGLGKYVEGDAGQGRSPLLQALERAVAAGLEQLFQPDAGVASLLQALGPSAGLFALYGSRLFSADAVSPVMGGETGEGAEERFTQALLTVVRWLHGFGQSIYLLIDDWGRAPLAHIALFERLIEISVDADLKILATERTSEPSPLSLRNDVCRIHLSPLDRAAQEAIVRDLLGPGPHVHDVLQLMEGFAANPFDLTLGAQVLMNTGSLVAVDGGWRLDRGLGAAALGERIAEPLARAIARSEASALELAQILAVIGDESSQSELQTLSGLDSADTAAAIRSLIDAGVIHRRAESLHFTHDRVRHAVFESASLQKQLELRRRIAEGMRRNLVPSERPRPVMLWRRIEAGVDHDVDGAVWAPLFAEGAAAARQSGDRDASVAFAETGLALAERAGGATYLALTEAIFSSITQCEFGQAIARAARLEAVAAGDREKAIAFEITVFTHRMAGDIPGALDAARRGLALTGVKLPTKIGVLQALIVLVRIFFTSPRWASRQPELTEAELALVAPSLRAVNATGSLLFEQDAKTAIVFAGGAIKAKVAAGTASGAGAYAFICAMMGAYGRAGRWAEISNKHQGSMQPLRAVARQYARNFGLWFTRPHSETLHKADALEALAYAEGDLAVAAYANQDRVFDYLLGSRSLEEAIPVADAGIRIAERFRDGTTGVPIRYMRQMMELLHEPSDASWRMQGRFIPPATAAAATTAGGNVRRLLGSLEAMLAVSFGAYEVAAELPRTYDTLFKALPFQSWALTWGFATGLALYRTGGRPSALSLIAQRRAARHCPTDYRHRVLLLQAEAARRAGRRDRCLKLYGQAVEASRGAASLLERGIVAQAGAECARMLQASDLAARFDKASDEAWSAFSAWGVLAHRRQRQTRADAPDVFPTSAQPETERHGDLAAALEAAERAHRAKSRFLAAVGHELKTPIQGMNALLEAMTASPTTSADITSLQTAVTRLSTIVEDLTDLGALEGGVFSLVNHVFDPAALCGEIAGLHAPLFQGEGRRLLVLTPEVQVCVVSDKARLGQILTNLISNAQKYTRGDVRVRLVVEDAQAERLDLAISVEDDGPGLSETELIRVFEPFERGALGQGLGIGLSLARALAIQLGGALVVTSTRETGSIFTLKLSLQIGRDDHRGRSRPAGRILLADDTEPVRSQLARQLRSAGQDVVEVSDGAAAVSATETQAPFDMAVLDYRMPHLDGLQTAATLRARHPELPVLIVTAGADASELAKAKAMGFSLLRKPIPIDAVLEHIGVPASGPGHKAKVVEFDPAAARTFARALNRLDRARCTHDRDGIADEAHRLCGLAAHIGLEALASAFRTLERNARDDGSADLEEEVITILAVARTQLPALLEPGLANELHPQTVHGAMQSLR